MGGQELISIPYRLVPLGGQLGHGRLHLAGAALQLGLRPLLLGELGGEAVHLRLELRHLPEVALGLLSALAGLSLRVAQTLLEILLGLLQGGAAALGLARALAGLLQLPLSRPQLGLEAPEPLVRVGQALLQVVHPGAASRETQDLRFGAFELLLQLADPALERIGLRGVGSGLRSRRAPGRQGRFCAAVHLRIGACVPGGLCV